MFLQGMPRQLDTHGLAQMPREQDRWGLDQLLGAEKDASPPAALSQGNMQRPCPGRPHGAGRKWGGGNSKLRRLP